MIAFIKEPWNKAQLKYESLNFHRWLQFFPFITDNNMEIDK